MNSLKTVQCLLIPGQNYLEFSVHICRVGHLILRALAIRATNSQNALARISFHLPKSLNSLPPQSTLPPPQPHRDHAVATAGQLAISPKNFLVLFLSYSFESWPAVVFFYYYFFCSSTTFGTPEIYFHILARIHLTFSNLPEEYALIKNNTLATLSRTLYTKGYNFNEKF